MSILLHTIKPAHGSTKKRKRVGRGNASGHGTYSTRGLKGQKSRSGASGLKRLGMKMTLMRVPKKKGFNSGKAKNQIINLFNLNIFKDGDLVSPKTLIQKGVIANIDGNIKVLGKGELKPKNLKIENIICSESAKKEIEKNGGSFVVKKK